MKFNCMKYFIGVLFFLISCISTYAEDVKLIEDRGIVQAYQISNNTRYMLSRDGSEAYAVPVGASITAPGDYYLTYYDESNRLVVETFTIPYPDEQITHFKVSNDSMLEEALKQILEQHTEEATVQIQYGHYTFEALFDKVKQSLNSVVARYPLLTYTEYRMTSSGGNRPVFTLEITYPQAPNVDFKVYTQQAKAQIPTILSSLVHPWMKDYEREQVIYTYLAERLTYANDVSLQMPHTLQGSLVDQSAVCDGYARTFMYLMNSVGVPTTMITGTTGDIGHAWNMIKIQNQNYHVDLTWGDQEENQVGILYNYFNESDLYMQETHEWDREAVPAADHLMYNPVFMKHYEAGVYQITNPRQWEYVKSQIVKEATNEMSLVFYQVSNHTWDTQAIVTEVATLLQKSITYTVIEKYDTLLIQCKY